MVLVSVTLTEFPAPLEVDRFLYLTKFHVLNILNMPHSFRPLARWIGSYTKEVQLGRVIKRGFPAPLEVDRYLYLKIFKEVGVYVNSFRPLSR